MQQEKWLVRYWTPAQLPVADNFDSGQVYRTVWLTRDGADADLERMSKKWRGGFGIVARTGNRDV